jgi:hypothetical protein
MAFVRTALRAGIIATMSQASSRRCWRSTRRTFRCRNSLCIGVDVISLIPSALLSLDSLDLDDGLRSLGLDHRGTTVRSFQRRAKGVAGRHESSPETQCHRNLRWLSRLRLAPLAPVYDRDAGSCLQTETATPTLRLQATRELLNIRQQFEI